MLNKVIFEGFFVLVLCHFTGYTIRRDRKDAKKNAVLGFRIIS